MPVNYTNPKNIEIIEHFNPDDFLMLTDVEPLVNSILTSSTAVLDLITGDLSGSGFPNTLLNLTDLANFITNPTFFNDPTIGIGRHLIPYLTGEGIGLPSLTDLDKLRNLPLPGDLFSLIPLRFVPPPPDTPQQICVGFSPNEYCLPLPQPPSGGIAGLLQGAGLIQLILIIVVLIFFGIIVFEFIFTNLRIGRRLRTVPGKRG